MPKALRDTYRNKRIAWYLCELLKWFDEYTSHTDAEKYSNESILQGTLQEYF